MCIYTYTHMYAYIYMKYHEELCLDLGTDEMWELREKSIPNILDDIDNRRAGLLSEKKEHCFLSLNKGV